MTSLFDIQVNGYAGVDFQQPDLATGDVRRAMEVLRQCQTYRILVTLITDRIEALIEKLEQWERLRADDALIAETVAGYHIEGPCLSPLEGYCGAHPFEFMKDPDPRDWDRLQKAAAGNIRMVTLAPERSGSAELIAHLAGQGIVVALGHTAAKDGDIDRAIAAGARLATHLGNGVPSQLHRHDNVTQRLLAREELIASFIPDGIHLPPPVLKNFVRAKSPDGFIFTTDCMAAAAAGPGSYRLGQLSLEVGPDRVVRLPGSQQFAGSSLTPLEGVRNVTDWVGLDRESAWAAFSVIPAALCGISLPPLDKVHDET